MPVTIISTNSLFHGIYSYLLAGNLSHFLFDHFYIGKCHNCWLLFKHIFLIWSRKMLSNHHFCSIQNRMKEIRMILIQHKSLEFWCNKFFILTHIKVKLLLLPPWKEPRLYLTVVSLAIRPGYLRLYWYIMLKVMGNLSSDISSMSKKLLHIFHYVIGIRCSIFMPISR